jgi:BirA family biotin operon repressor/biotin-[acetyl-CoA-carboxylase] ligase
MSEMQHAGRGSRGKTWVSPFGHNIYLSISTGLPGGTNVMDGLSLVCGLAVLKTLSNFGLQQLGLKWPNDVLIGDKKIAGVLVEVAGEVAGHFHVVIGVGINVKMPASLMREVEQPWSCLEHHGFRPELRNNLAGQLISGIVQTFNQFTQHGLSRFNHELAQYDMTLDREIVLISQSKTVQGKGAGIAVDGSLRISTPDGVFNFRSGQVSLRLGS